MMHLATHKPAHPHAGVNHEHLELPALLKDRLLR